MKKKPTIAALKKRVWKLFSLMVRLEESSAPGQVFCKSCCGEGKGGFFDYRECHAGHFIPKSQGLKIYFERRNVHTQCVGCNLFKHGNLSAYAVWMERMYGSGIFEELMAIKNSKPMGSAEARAFLEKIEEETKEKLKNLTLSRQV